jgi:hypothetical protein
LGAPTAVPMNGGMIRLPGPSRARRRAPLLVTVTTALALLAGCGPGGGVTGDIAGGGAGRGREAPAAAPSGAGAGFDLPAPVAGDSGGSPSLPESAPAAPEAASLAPSGTGDAAGNGTTAVAGASVRGATALRDNKVFVLGDSVLLATKDVLPARLPGWDVTMDAVVSRRIDAGLKVLEQRRSELGSVAVFHQCTNYSKGEGFAGKLDKALTLMHDVQRIVLVTCTNWSPGQPEANAAIAAAAARDSRITVADWAAVSGTAGFTGADKIHLLPAGVQALSALVAAQVGPSPRLDGPSVPTPPAIPAPPTPSR